MSDLIDRQALMDVLGIAMECDDCEKNDAPFCGMGSEFVNACEAIAEAPSAEPGWIPVTERLPEEAGLYLISHKNGKVFLDKWLGYDGWDSFISVTAWMQLPEPYKGGDA